MSTKGYNFETPEWLWEAFKGTVTQNDKIEDVLHECMAERVVEHPLIDDDVQERAAEQYLNGDREW